MVFKGDNSSKMTVWTLARENASRWIDVIEAGILNDSEGAMQEGHREDFSDWNPGVIDYFKRWNGLNVIRNGVDRTIYLVCQEDGI
jgi:hypothetical protein